MEKILLDENKNFYKGNMHCHSTISDGNLTPSELKELYKRRGYSFLAITDHEFLEDNSYLDDEKFITITGTEYAIKEFPDVSTLKNFDMKVCHLNLYAKEQHNVNNILYSSVADHYSSPEKKKEKIEKYGDIIRKYSCEDINNLIKTANESGFFVSYNHPRWSLENYAQYSKYNGLWGVEIFNTNCDVSGIYEYNINVLDDFLRDGKKIYASCGDDNHNRASKQDSFGAFVMVNADKLEYKNIIDGLLCGSFYSSTGPEITSLIYKENKVIIKCSSAQKITLSTRGRYAESVIAREGEYIFGAEFDLREEFGYFRLDVIDGAGKRANTQAYSVIDGEIYGN